MKEIYELKGAGRSIREIARELDVSRNTVRRYLKTPEAMRPKPRRRRVSKLDAHTEYIDRRMAQGLENCVVLHRELAARGYGGGYSILKGYMSPRRRKRQPEATLRFETAPGEQAQVDWGSLSYLSEDGKRRSVWVFVMAMGWSRACYVELVRRGDTAAFIQCHVNAFEYPGGVPRRCLYDNAKVVTPGRDEEQRPVWKWTYPVRISREQTSDETFQVGGTTEGAKMVGNKVTVGNDKGQEIDDTVDTAGNLNGEQEDQSP